MMKLFRKEKSKKPHIIFAGGRWFCGMNPQRLGEGLVMYESKWIGVGLTPTSAFNDFYFQNT
jgi:hypothetical protein